MTKPKLKQSETILIAVMCLLLFGLLGYLGWQQLENRGIIKVAPPGVLLPQGGPISEKAYEICKKRGGSEGECVLEAIPDR